MRGTVAKRLRRATYGDNVSGAKGRRYQWEVPHQRTVVADQLRQAYQAAKGALRSKSQTSPPEPPKPRRSYEERARTALDRGIAESDERRDLMRGDKWLQAQPWMTIQRLRRVAALRRAFSQ